MKKNKIIVLVSATILSIGVIATSAINTYANTEGKRRELKFDQMIAALDQETDLTRTYAAGMIQQNIKPDYWTTKVIRDMSDCVVTTDTEGNQHVEYKYNDAYVASVIACVKYNWEYRDYYGTLQDVRDKYDSETTDFETCFLAAVYNYSSAYDDDMVELARYYYNIMPYLRTYVENYYDCNEDIRNERAETALTEYDYGVTIFDYERR